MESQQAAAGGAAVSPREDTAPFVPQLNDARRMEMIADLMAGRGHGARTIEKVLGANWLRLFGEVWR